MGIEVLHAPRSCKDSECTVSRLHAETSTTALHSLAMSRLLGSFPTPSLNYTAREGVYHCLALREVHTLSYSAPAGIERLLPFLTCRSISNKDMHLVTSSGVLYMHTFANSD